MCLGGSRNRCPDMPIVVMDISPARGIDGNLHGSVWSPVLQNSVSRHFFAECALCFRAPIFLVVLFPPFLCRG